MLTQEELKELLHYNPETGVFTWKVSRGRQKEGQVAGYKDNHKGYLRVTVKCRPYRVHRLVWLYMTGEWPKHQVDHINGVKSDNRWSNLREATNQQNSFNKKSHLNSSSQYKGVYWCKNTLKWRGEFEVSKDKNRIRKRLGRFDCEHEAALVYNQFVMKHHGEYARFNQVYNHFDVEVGRDD